MGHSYTAIGGWGDITVTKSNPSGNIVRFTISDNTTKFHSARMIRSVLQDAIDQWIAAERADLDTNGDTAVKGSEEYVGHGDGFSQFSWNYSGLYAEVTLTAKTNISVTGDITVSIPYSDVI
jgi:hypothetical protein